METFEIGNVNSGHTASVPVKIRASTHAETQGLEHFSLDRSKRYENRSLEENILLRFRWDETEAFENALMLTGPQYHSLDNLSGLTHRSRLFF